MPKNRKTAVGVAAALVIPALFLCATRPADAEALVCNLDRCLQQALDRNPLLKLARIEIQSAEATLLKKKAAFLPRLDLHLSAVEFSGEPTSPFSVFGVTEAEIVNRRIIFGEYAALTVDFNYPIYREGSLFGINAPSLASAETQKRRETFSEIQTREEIIYDVTESFLTALWKMEKVRLAEKRVQWSQQQLSVIQAEIGLNLRSPHEMELARTDLAMRQEALQAAKTAGEEAMANLARQIGLSDPDQIELDGTYPPLPDLPPLTRLFERAEQSHPKIGIQQTLLDRSQADLLANRSHRWPTLALQSSYTYADDFSLPGNNYFQALLKLEMPLYDFGGYRAEAAESQTRLRAEEIRLETVRETIRNEIARAYAEIHEVEGRVTVIEKETLKAEVQLKLVRARREQGLVGPLAVLEAESHLLDLRQSLADAHHERPLKYAALQKMAGGIWK